MIRQTKYFLATSCLIALGIIVYRFASLGNTVYYPGKTKIYSFNLGNHAVTIKHDNLNQVENVKWSKDSARDDDILDDIIGDATPAATAAKPVVELTERPHIKVTTEIPTVYRTTSKKTTVKLATPKATVKSVVTLPPLTKPTPPLTKLAPLLTKPPSTKPPLHVTMPKATISVVTYKPGDLPKCSPEGENLGKYWYTLQKFHGKPSNKIWSSY
jgi:hypothetical protein